MKKKILQLLLTLQAMTLNSVLFHPQKIFAADTTVQDAIGGITKPKPTEYYALDDVNQLPYFVSTLLGVFAVFMGLWVLINIIIASYGALTSSGDPQALSKIKTSIVNSAVGLLLIVMAYTIAALVGLVLFGDSTLFINPKF